MFKQQKRTSAFLVISKFCWLNVLAGKRVSFLAHHHTLRSLVGRRGAGKGSVSGPDDKGKIL